MTKKFNVLVLCTGNSARSILAEGLLNHLGGHLLNAYSAGSIPTGTPHPLALEVLKDNGIDTSFAKSKSWTHFSDKASPQMDLVITVCANAAGEVCPVWHGKPTTAHWGVDDPASGDGSNLEKRQKFKLCFQQIKERITVFIEGLEDGNQAEELALAVEKQFSDKLI